MMTYMKPQMSVAANELALDSVVWYVVAIAILACLAIIIVCACVLYCLRRGKSFTGSYNVNKTRGTVTLGCT